jgi:hypothetical protein
LTGQDRHRDALFAMDRLLGAASGWARSGKAFDQVRMLKPAMVARRGRPI